MRIWKFSDNVNTDEIIPARFNITIVPDELARHVFCEVRPEFAQEVKEGDILVAGENFGCGSSREHAPIAIKASGIHCIIAKSFARIFFRNCINIGLPILECRDSEKISDITHIDFENGLITTPNGTLQTTPLPSFVMKIVDAGGIVNFVKNHDIEELQ